MNHINSTKYNFFHGLKFIIRIIGLKPLYAIGGLVLVSFLVNLMIYFTKDSTTFLENENLVLLQTNPILLPSPNGVYFEKSSNNIILTYEGTDIFTRIDLETNKEGKVINSKSSELENQVNNSFVIKGVPPFPPSRMASYCDRNPTVDEISLNDNLLVLDFSKPFYRGGGLFSAKKHPCHLMMDFYEIHSDNSEFDEKSYKTIFLGSIFTNRYLPMVSCSNYVALSSDRKYIAILVRGVIDHKELGEYAGRNLLQVWRIEPNIKEDNLFREELKTGFWRINPGVIVPLHQESE